VSKLVSLVACCLHVMAFDLHWFRQPLLVLCSSKPDDHRLGAALCPAGVPLRVTLGPREVTSDTVTLSIHPALVPLLLASAGPQLREELERYTEITKAQVTQPNNQQQEQEQLQEQHDKQKLVSSKDTAQQSIVNQQCNEAAISSSKASRRTVLQAAQGAVVAAAAAGGAGAGAPASAALQLHGVPATHCAALAVSILTSLARHSKIMTSASSNKSKASDSSSGSSEVNTCSSSSSPAAGQNRRCSSSTGAVVSAGLCMNGQEVDQERFPLTPEVSALTLSRCLLPWGYCTKLHLTLPGENSMGARGPPGAVGGGGEMELAEL
jgi:hypothetical protein